MKSAINVLQNRIYELRRASAIVGSNPATESNIKEYEAAIRHLRSSHEHQKKCSHYYVPVGGEYNGETGAFICSECGHRR